MTDNEIIKALECCEANEGESPNCKECPYPRLQEYDDRCYIEVRKQALDLINRQQAEIEFLQSSKNLHEAEFESLKTELELAKAFHKEAVAERDLLNIQLKEAKAEIERLENECFCLANERDAYKDVLDTSVTEAVKEFAEELIYKIVNTPTKFESTYYMYREGIAFRQNEIIDIIKEMAGEEK